jgi:hypothetical protein
MSARHSIASSRSIVVSPASQRIHATDAGLFPFDTSQPKRQAQKKTGLQRTAIPFWSGNCVV